MPAVLACVFGGSLRRGRQPLIEGVARASRGGVLPDELVVYTRHLTQLWTLVFIAMFLAALALILLRHREGISEAPRLGTARVRTCRSRWLPHPLQKKTH